MGTQREVTNPPRPARNPRLPPQTLPPTPLLRARPPRPRSRLRSRSVRPPKTLNSRRTDPAQRLPRRSNLVKELAVYVMATNSRHEPFLASDSGRLQQVGIIAKTRKIC